MFRRHRHLKRILTVAATVYILVAAGMFFMQRSLYYKPDRALNYPYTYELDMELNGLVTLDGVRLTAWISRAKDNQPTLVYFHGNAGHLGTRNKRFKAFQEAGLGIVAISYRGFGTSEGSPSEQGLFQDAQAAMALARTLAPDDKLILFGESLGTGVAMAMALENPTVKAVVLEAPYRSIAARGKELYPWLPVDWLILDRFDNEERAPDLKIPLLVFASDTDTVVPYAHSQRVYELAGTSKKTFITYKDTGHSSFDTKRQIDDIRAFLSGQ